MRKTLQKIKSISLALALLFFLSTSLMSAHAHAKTHEEHSHTCTVCQFSHSGNRTLSSENTQLPIDLIPVSAAPEHDFIQIFSDPIQVPSIRGPPQA